MTLSITHHFVSPIADDAAALATGKVCPQAHWNHAHDFTGVLDAAHGGTGNSTGFLNPTFTGNTSGFIDPGTVIVKSTNGISPSPRIDFETNIGVIELNLGYDNSNSRSFIGFESGALYIAPDPTSSPGGNVGIELQNNTLLGIYGPLSQSISFDDSGTFTAAAAEFDFIDGAGDQLFLYNGTASLSDYVGDSIVMSGGTLTLTNQTGNLIAIGSSGIDMAAPVNFGEAIIDSSLFKSMDTNARESYQSDGLTVAIDWTGSYNGLASLSFAGTTANFAGIVSAVALTVAGGKFAISAATGKITEYGNVATKGLGVPAIYGQGRATGQTAANASIATYTPGGDSSFLVSANVNVTASTTHSFSVTVSYTDETNTARTLTLNFSQISGTILSTITNVQGTGAYEGLPVHIRCKASTAITIKTVGTFTSVTYNAEGYITQIG